MHRDYPHLFLMGEAWTDASQIAGYLQDGLDSCLDFPFQGAIAQAYGGNAPDLTQVARVLDTDALYLDPMLMGTFIDNHDAPRFIGLSDTPDAVRRLRAALGVLFTFRGIPVIHYGTEAGAEPGSGAGAEGGAEAQKERLPLNIGLVLDRSGSMTGEPLEYVKEAACFVADQLSAKDRFSLVTFDTEVDVLCPSQEVQYKDALKARIRGIQSGSSTNLSGGLLRGYEEVQKENRAGQVNRLVLLSRWNGQRRHHQSRRPSRQEAQHCRKGHIGFYRRGGKAVRRGSSDRHGRDRTWEKLPLSPQFPYASSLYQKPRKLCVLESTETRGFGSGRSFPRS